MIWSEDTQVHSRDHFIESVLIIELFLICIVMHMVKRMFSKAFVRWLFLFVQYVAFRT